MCERKRVESMNKQIKRTGISSFLGESSFSMMACASFEELTQNNVLTARITSYSKDCPCLELYAPQWTGQVGIYT